MNNAEAVNWLINITADIGKIEHQDLWHYEQALSEIREMLEDAPTIEERRTKMSVENGKVCCNCRHCIRSRDEKYDMIVCRCEISGEYLGYVRVMEGWCRHWAKEKEQKQVGGHQSMEQATER